MIWKTAQGLIHQEIWYNDSSGWKPAGHVEKTRCGKTQFTSSPDPKQEVEFRIDLSNVTYSGIDLAIIRPSGAAGYGYDFGFAHHKRKHKGKMQRNN